jgi:D-tagatose-1,6-bisphosphate aldolase subunit GatZ/KbaZ
MSHPLDEIVKANKRGEIAGIASLCSAHPWVLRTALRGPAPVLIEATCNQVNQFGGYTGMTPETFVTFVRNLAIENNFRLDGLILGGDHLGPSPWQGGPGQRAMEKAADMVRAYVRAGFTKLHIDASMKLGDDASAGPPGLQLAAHRTAWLVKAAEEAQHQLAGTAPEIRYVIGTEVPIPGGATVHEDGVAVTTVEDAGRTIEATKHAFVKAHLESAWERVIALVVQPGVEFGDDFILDYKPLAAIGLARFAETIPFIYEAHSTDYQRRDNLQALVRDHFAILKVGPALTYAFREAVFALVMMECELIPVADRSRLIETLDNVMTREPVHWKKHFRGNERELAFARKYSLSDRVRYYWSDPAVQTTLGKLFANLDTVTIPLSLISQYMPDTYRSIRAGSLPNTASSIVSHRIQVVLDDYRIR